MDASALQFGIVLIFLAALVVMNRLRDLFIAIHSEDYKKIITGITVLCFSSVLNLLHQSLALSSLPFVSEELFVNVVCWSANLSGMILLLSGTARWLPVYQKYLKAQKNNNNQAELIQYVEQLTQVENRIHVIINNCISRINDAYQFEDGTAVLYSHKNKKFYQNGIGSTKIELNLNHNTLAQLVNDYEQGNKETLSRIITLMLQESSEKIFTLPLEINNRLGGLFFFKQNEDCVIEKPKLNHIKLVLDILSQRITTDCLRQIEQKNQETIDKISSIKKQLNVDGDTKENISLVLEQLKKTINYDFASFLVFEDQNRTREFTASNNNQGMLIKTNLCDNSNLTLANHLKQNNLTVHIKDLGRETDIVVDNILLKSDMRSLYAAPVFNGSKVIGAFMVASNKIDDFSVSQINFMNSMESILSVIALNEARQIRNADYHSQQNIINDLLGKLSFSVKSSSYSAYVASVLKNELPYNLIRISAYEDNFVVSKALALDNLDRQTAPANAALVLGIMPYHNQVKETGKSFYIKQTDSNPVTDSEQSQFFGQDLKRTLLVPIKKASKVIGVISLGDTSDENEQTVNETEFVQMIAKLIALSWKEDQSSKLQVEVNNRIKSELITSDAKKELIEV